MYPKHPQTTRDLFSLHTYRSSWIPTSSTSRCFLCFLCLSNSLLSPFCGSSFCLHFSLEEQRHHTLTDARNFGSTSLHQNPRRWLASQNKPPKDLFKSSFVVRILEDPAYKNVEKLHIFNGHFGKIMNSFAANKVQFTTLLKPRNFASHWDWPQLLARKSCSPPTFFKTSREIFLRKTHPSRGDFKETSKKIGTSITSLLEKTIEVWTELRILGWSVLDSSWLDRILPHPISTPWKRMICSSQPLGSFSVHLGV